MKPAYLLVFKYLLLGYLALLSNQSALAHAGPHSDSRCFISLGDTQVRINGYYLDNQFVGKHFCRIFPATGQILLAIDVLADSAQASQAGLNLAALAPWSEWPQHLFKPLNHLPPKPIGSGLIGLSQTIDKPALYALDVTLIDAKGLETSTRMFVIAGLPVTKVLIYFAGLMLLIIVVSQLKALRNRT